MQKYIININTKTANEMISIIPIFDLHIISNTFDEKLFTKYVEYIANHDNVYWFCGGDISEFITIGDKRFNPSDIREDLKINYLADIAQIEMDMFKKLANPILTPEKCLGLGEGNHESKLAKNGQRDITRSLCKEFNLRYLGYSGFLKFVFSRGACNSRRPFVVYYHHGWFTSRTSGSKVNNAEKMALSHECNIAVTGHCHSRISTGPIDFGTFDGVKLKYGIVCGSFKKGVDLNKKSYEERRGFNSQRYRMGSWSIDIIPYPTNDAQIMYQVSEFNPDWSKAIDKFNRRIYA